jgi:hypothetical protein
MLIRRYSLRASVPSACTAAAAARQASTYHFTRLLAMLFVVGGLFHFITSYSFYSFSLSSI